VSTAGGLILATALTAKSGGLATFRVNGTATQVQVARDLTVDIGDVCAVGRIGSQWVAVSRHFLTATVPPEDNVPAPPAVAPTVTGTLVCPAVETRSWRAAGWRTDVDDVIQGQYGTNGNHTGVAFYGTTPASITGATVTAATVLLRRAARGGGAGALPLTLRLVTQSTRPAGAPTLGASTAGPVMRWGQLLRYDLPTAWGQELVDGTAGGLAVYEADGSPYLIMDGRAAFGASCTVTIDWQRTT